MCDVQATVLEILGRHAESAALDRPPERIDLLSLGIDSAEMINVIIAIEDAFDLDVEEEYIHELRTVADVVRAVTDRVRR